MYSLAENIVRLVDGSGEAVVVKLPHSEVDVTLQVRMYVWYLETCFMSILSQHRSRKDETRTRVQATQTPSRINSPSAVGSVCVENEVNIGVPYLAGCKWPNKARNIYMIEDCVVSH
jgi:hypothetical protein